MVKRSKSEQRLDIRTADTAFQVKGYFGQVGAAENDRTKHQIATKLCGNEPRSITDTFAKFGLASGWRFQVIQERVVFFLLPRVFAC